MQMRVMQPGDYDSMAALWLSCKGMGLNSLDDSRAGIERFLHRNPETCFVTLEDGNIVGTILCGNDGRRGYIYHLAVAEPFRRRGIASALVQRTLDALRREGIAKAALVVFCRNESGNRFWEQQGFVLRTDIAYRNRELAEMERIDT